jgi:hypothetical protein
LSSGTNGEFGNRDKTAEYSFKLENFGYNFPPLALAAAEPGNFWTFVFLKPRKKMSELLAF